jgi:hypothetical protein
MISVRMHCIPDSREQRLVSPSTTDASFSERTLETIRIDQSMPKPNRAGLPSSRSRSACPPHASYRLQAPDGFQSEGMPLC